MDLLKLNNEEDIYKASFKVGNSFGILIMCIIIFIGITTINLKPVIAGIISVLIALVGYVIIAVPTQKISYILLMKYKNRNNKIYSINQTN